MMPAEFTPGAPSPVGRPKELFMFDRRDLVMACIPIRCCDVAPDGLRFYATQRVTPPKPPKVTPINLMLNWFAELKAKLPIT